MPLIPTLSSLLFSSEPTTATEPTNNNLLYDTNSLLQTVIEYVKEELVPYLVNELRVFEYPSEERLKNDWYLTLGSKNANYFLPLIHRENRDVYLKIIVREEDRHQDTFRDVYLKLLTVGGNYVDVKFYLSDDRSVYDRDEEIKDRATVLLHDIGKLFGKQQEDDNDYDELPQE